MSSHHRSQLHWLSLLSVFVGSACGGTVEPAAGSDVADAPRAPVAGGIAAADASSVLPVPVPARNVTPSLGTCARCEQTVADACAIDTDCPPALRTQAFHDWCAEVESRARARPVVAARCEGLLLVSYGTGVDCAQRYAFDERSGALVGVVDVSCNSLRSECSGSDTCIPQCCLDGSCVTPAPAPCGR